MENKIQQSKYYKENVNLNSPEGNAIDNLVSSYINDKVKPTNETKKSLSESSINLTKTIAKKMNSILKNPPPKTNKSVATQNNRKRKAVDSSTRGI